MAKLFEMDGIFGFLAPIGISVLIFVLNALLPGKWVTGYITRPNSPEKMKYRLNGILVFFVVIILWFLSGYFNIVPFDWLYSHRWSCFGRGIYIRYHLYHGCSLALSFRKKVIFV